MANNYVQVAPNSTGLKVDTTELTVGANTVERQNICVADPTTAANVATVSAAGALKVDASATTQPVSIAATVPVSLASLPALPTGANVIGSLAANQSVNVAQVNGSTVVAAATGVQKVGISGNAGASVDSAILSGAAPTNVVWHTNAPSSVASAALSAKIFSAVAVATNIKASAGNLYGFTLVSATATAGFVQFFNTATTATSGAVLIVPIAASGTITLTPSQIALLNFSTGIAINVATTVGGPTQITVTGTVFYL